MLTQAANRIYLANDFCAEIGEEAVADLYILMERLFPPETDPEGPSGLVSPRQMVSSLRDDLPRYLAAIGTEEAVRALRRLVVEQPNNALLRFELSRGEFEMRLKTWSPLTVKDIFAMTDRPNSRLITSDADLLGILKETLAKYETELHGAQTPVRDLWDRQGRSRKYRPIDENGFSDVIVRYLRRELGGTGIFANREVEVKRIPGSPVGTRTDILINAIRNDLSGQPIYSITAVIEVKGCWNRELFTALDDQLVSDYMVRLGARVGIYLVAWFDTAQWDDKDTRRRQVHGTSIDDLKSRLKQQTAVIPEGFQVEVIVLEIRAPGT